jgi:hypothetical protein
MTSIDSTLQKSQMSRTKGSVWGFIPRRDSLHECCTRPAPRPPPRRKWLGSLLLRTYVKKNILQVDKPLTNIQSRRPHDTDDTEGSRAAVASSPRYVHTVHEYSQARFAWNSKVARGCGHVGWFEQDVRNRLDDAGDAVWTAPHDHRDHRDHRDRG